MHQQMTDVAAGEGLAFRFDIARSANTFDAHRLVHLAADHGLQDAMKERLLRAHLEEGELISDHATLERLATEVGVPAGEAREMLLTERYAEQVREDERLASGFGIQAVPFFAIDRAIGASGAQAPEVLLDGLRRAWERRQAQPLPAVVTGGEACGPDGC
jgi:predicted DsbA family dithiol-disulfide isomerase